MTFDKIKSLTLENNVALAYLFALFVGALILKRATDGPQVTFSRLAGVLMGAGLGTTFVSEAPLLRDIGFYVLCAGLALTSAMLMFECLWNVQQTMVLLRNPPNA